MTGSDLAIFEDAPLAYKADSCDPLKQAHRRGSLALFAVGRGCYPGRRLAHGVLPGVRSLGFWDADCDQNWGLDWHRNEGVEIALMERGHCAFHIAGEIHDLLPGHLTITRPWQPHRLGNPHIPACRLGWLILDVGGRRPNQDWRWPDWICLAAKDRNRLTRLLRGSEHPVLTASRALRGTFGELLAVLETGETPRLHSRLAVGINELLLQLLENQEQSALPLDESLSSSTRTVRMFLDEIKAHPSQQARPWSVELMAERCGLKPHRFTQLVREQLNLSPLRFLNDCRMNSAKRLLETTRLTAVEIASACGYGSSQYFSLVFKRATGHTPNAWRCKATP